MRLLLIREQFAELKFHFLYLDINLSIAHSKIRANIDRMRGIFCSFFQRHSEVPEALSRALSFSLKVLLNIVQNAGHIVQNGRGIE